MNEEAWTGNLMEKIHGNISFYDPSSDKQETRGICPLRISSEVSQSHFKTPEFIYITSPLAVLSRTDLNCHIPAEYIPQCLSATNNAAQNVNS